MERLRSAFQTFLRTWLRPVSLATLARDERVMGAARALVSFYYAAVPILAYMFMTSGLEDRGNFEPLWPLWWTQLHDLDVATVVVIAKLGFVVISVVGAFWYRSWFARVLVFFAIFQVHALESSFGYINHQWYTWLYTSLILVFLPNVWRNSSFHVRRKFLLQIWFAQAMVMLTYFMAGLHKFYAVGLQWSRGEIHGLHPLAFSYQSADWVRQLQAPAELASSIINHPELWWLPYLALYFVQLFALWVMVRTSLQRVWGSALLLFHFGTFLSMGITFREQFVLVVVLFMATPFALDHLTARRFLLDLPLVGQVYEWSLRKKGRWEAQRS